MSGAGPPWTLSAAEKGEVVDELLAARPDLRKLAEANAAQRLPVEDRFVVADDVEAALRGLDIEELNGPTGTVHASWRAGRTASTVACAPPAQGLRTDRLEDAVPMVPHRPSGLVRHLEPARLTQLIASLDSVSPRGRRDRAIILCMARLGLRASEVAQLRLEDLDWRNATVRVRARKTGHGALLPLTVEVGAALADYLAHARPDTSARQVFVLHWLRVGAPISDSIVGRAVDNALRRAGMDAPIRGANLLRHSLATDLLDRGASLREIADVLGHASLATTRVYAAVDVATLREVALPWPQATS